MKKIIIFYAIIFLFTFHFQSFGNSPVGGKSSAMANASVAVPDFWSLANNPAIIPFYNQLAVGVSYKNQFLLKETSTTSIGATIPVDKAGSFGFYMSHFGYKYYGKLDASIIYAKSFANVFSFGLHFDYLFSYFGDAYYGSRSGFTFGVGTYGQITDALAIGFYVYNPARLKIVTYNDVKEYIPTILRFGLSYLFAKKCLLTIEAEKELDLKMLYRLGVEYEFAKYLKIRGGVSFPDFLFTLGVGTELKRFSIDFASSYHAVLGYSPQLSMVYTIKRKKDD